MDMHIQVRSAAYTHPESRLEVLQTFEVDEPGSLSTFARLIALG